MKVLISVFIVGVAVILLSIAVIRLQHDVNRLERRTVVTQARVHRLECMHLQGDAMIAHSNLVWYRRCLRHLSAD